MDNKYTGEVPLKIGAHNGILVYDWAALAAARSQISQADLDNIAQMAPDRLAVLCAAGFLKKSPEITADIIMQSNPPIMEVATAIDRALLFAYHGPENARALLEPLDKAVDAVAKKNAKPGSKKTQSQ